MIKRNSKEMWREGCLYCVSYGIFVTPPLTPRPPPPMTTRRTRTIGDGGYELALAPPMPPSPRSRRPPSSWSTSTIFIDVVSPIIINNNITNRSNNSNSPARGGRRVRGILSFLVVTRLSSYLGGWEIGADVDPQTMKTTSEGNVDRVMLDVGPDARDREGD